MADKYSYVITNVPYLKRGKQSEILQKYCEKNFPTGKSDLATVFLERCLQFCSDGGTSNVVLPQNWLFLTTFTKFREKLLRAETWHMLARLGPGAFETISGEVVKALLVSLSRGRRQQGFSLDADGAENKKFDETRLHDLDVSALRTASEKARGLTTMQLKVGTQDSQLNNPNFIISSSDTDFSQLIGDIAKTAAGLSSFDRPQYFHHFWEIVRFGMGWIPSQSAVNKITPFGGCEYAFLWEDGEGRLKNYMSERKRLEGYTSAIWRAGSQYWGTPGVLVSLMGNLPATFYAGGAFDQNTALIVPRQSDNLKLIWEYCKSAEFSEQVRLVDQSIKVTTATLEKVPIDLDSWRRKVENVNNLPKPHSDDPTQWIFHGHPTGSDDPLQVAVARLLGYQWPAELDAEMELSDEARSKLAESAKLLPLADEDGIVCIPAVRGEAAAADRLRDLLAAAYGAEWSNATLSQLLADADYAGKKLELWLREKFFIQHCKRFQHRPFIWHIWDGLNDGFAALVNYHKFDAKALETLIYTYLGDWISRQQQDIRNGVDGAQEKLAAAENLKQRLEAIREGEAPYDIFVRWKPLEHQPIGWDPDLNDGVRLNIRPFMTGPDLKKRGAGILREKPNIHWKKDRGKDVESAPWFHLFQGERINDHHLSREEKEAAST